jgi:hypothetical protein
MPQLISILTARPSRGITRWRENALETYPLRGRRTVSVMDVDLDPPQPDVVAAAVQSLLAAEERPAPDPWWAEGRTESPES